MLIGPNTKFETSDQIFWERIKKEKREKMKSEKNIEILDRLSGNMAKKYSTNGTTRTVALKGNTCAKCGKPADEFKDDVSRAEYKISAWCQVCQDQFFG